MRAVLRVIISTIIGGVYGAISFGLPMYWYLLPSAKALLGAVPVGFVGFILCSGIELVVMLMNSRTIEAMLIGASAGTLLIGIVLFQVGSRFFVVPEYIWGGIIIMVITTVIGLIMSFVVRRIKTLILLQVNNSSIRKLYTLTKRSTSLIVKRS